MIIWEDSLTLNEILAAMDPQQATASFNTPPAPAPPGLFGTKIPSLVSFAVALSLFFMPFADIRCNNTSLQTVSGVQLATGFKMKNGSSTSSFLNDIKTDKMDEAITRSTTRTNRKDPNLYGMVALGLGVLGLLLSLPNTKAAAGGAMVTAIGSAGALIGMMLDIKKKVRMDLASSGRDNAEGGIGKGLEVLGNEISDKMNIRVDFTPWFYVAIAAFLAAAFFSYKRMSPGKN